jgi:uncharacterized protein (TIGR02001 family)
MKKMVVAALAAVALSAGPALAADLVTKAKPIAAAPATPEWDIGFGGAVASDYIWRGITQSAHEPAVAAYFEPRWNPNKDWQFYLGVGGASIKFPNGAAAEVDFYGGVRATFDKLAVDVGAWYYWYPGGENSYVFYGSSPASIVPAISNASFYEIYGRANYTINDWVSINASVYYTPSYLNTGASGTYYSGGVKFTAPANWLPNGIGAYLSGEVARQELGTTEVDNYVYFLPVDLKSYTTWNVGIGFTWKVLTLDLRYIDTNLSKADCNVITGDPHASYNTSTGLYESNWCGARFVARLSADVSVLSNIK